VDDWQLETPPGDETQVRVPPSLHPEQVLTPSTLGTQYTSNVSADTESGEPSAIAVLSRAARLMVRSDGRPIISEKDSIDVPTLG